MLQEGPTGKLCIVDAARQGIPEVQQHDPPQWLKQGELEEEDEDHEVEGIHGRDQDEVASEDEQHLVLQ